MTMTGEAIKSPSTHKKGPNNGLSSFGPYFFLFLFCLLTYDNDYNGVGIRETRAGDRDGICVSSPRYMQFFVYFFFNYTDASVSFTVNLLNTTTTTTMTCILNP